MQASKRFCVIKAGNYINALELTSIDNNHKIKNTTLQLHVKLYTFDLKITQKHII